MQNSHAHAQDQNLHHVLTLEELANRLVYLRTHHLPPLSQRALLRRISATGEKPPCLRQLKRLEKAKHKPHGKTLFKLRTVLHDL